MITAIIICYMLVSFVCMFLFWEAFLSNAYKVPVYRYILYMIMSLLWPIGLPIVLLVLSKILKI